MKSLETRYQKIRLSPLSCDSIVNHKRLVFPQGAKEYKITLLCYATIVG